MVYESYPWKLDLARRKRLLVKYNTPEHFKNNEEATYTVIEKAIFYSAFIIRKLIDCKVKLSDEADNYTMNIVSRKPLKNVDIMHRWPKTENYDWLHENQIVVNGRDVCNWLIHSYVFFLLHDEEGRVCAFCVSSDYDRNKVLYTVGINEWLDYIDFISSDEIVSISSRYDTKANDYVFRYNERTISSESLSEL